MKYKVWDCKLVIPFNSKTPKGFDSPPRRAVIDIMDSYGFEVLACYSGWGGTLDKEELQIIKKEKKIKTDKEENIK